MPPIKALTVLSLFDGMSCGQIALERAGIPVKKYYASEIDKYAIQVTKKNYPNTIHLGDIQNWKDWEIDTPDLIIAGSPCQGFSIAGKGLNFDDPRSKLFFTFIDILRYWQACNPNLKFLLENVKMKQGWKDIISEQVGLKPILINSSLLSAQNRERLYWANWEISQPEDKGIFLKDIIEHGEVDREKSYTVDANYFKGGNPKSYFEKGRRQLVFKHQSHTRAMVKEPDNGLVQVASLYKNNGDAGRIYSVEGKAKTLKGEAGDGGAKMGLISEDGYTYRKLTVLECERLQTAPEGYTEGVSDTQRYKMLGNGWTVDVIAHIFKALPQI